MKRKYRRLLAEKLTVEWRRHNRAATAAVQSPRPCLCGVRFSSVNWTKKPRGRWIEFENDDIETVVRRSERTRYRNVRRIVRNVVVRVDRRSARARRTTRDRRRRFTQPRVATRDKTTDFYELSLSSSHHSRATGVLFTSTCISPPVGPGPVISLHARSRDLSKLTVVAVVAV